MVALHTWFHTAVERFWLLPLGAGIALVWANLAPESYFWTAHRLAFPVNEIGMTVFVALAAQDAFESLRPGGPLHTWRRWVLPVVAALGGCLGAAAIYLAEVRAFEYAFVPGWPAALVIDLGLVYLVARAIFGRSPAVPFIVAMSIVTGAISVAALTLVQPVPAMYSGGIVLMVMALLSAVWMQRAGIAAFLPYFLISGSLSWSALYISGYHPAFAMVPVVPFLPHVRRSISHFLEAPDVPGDPLRHGEYVWHVLAQVVLFAFALVNAGSLLWQYGHGTWAMLGASVVGRPLGMLAAVAVGLGLGLTLPGRLGWRDMVVVALASASGFTMALFVATALWGPGPILGQIRLGALGSVVTVALAFGAARLLGVGRFHVRDAHPKGHKVTS
jgi:NhaA family Na+:H+ antiporter